MKYILLLLLAACSTSAPRKMSNEEKARARQYVLDVTQSAHMTGCIDGFLAFIEEGWYVRPKGATAEQIVQAYREICEEKNVRYRLESSMNLPVAE